MNEVRLAGHDITSGMKETQIGIGVCKTEKEMGG
jgi:hypothetical protein